MAGEAFEEMSTQLRDAIEKDPRGHLVDFQGHLIDYEQGHEATEEETHGTLPYHDLSTFELRA